MSRIAGIAAAALFAAVLPALAQEGGPIQSGEHGSFSRLVLQIDPAGAWTLEQGEGRAILRLPDRRVSFRTDRVFDLIPRSRIADIAVRTGETGTEVELTLACDCRIGTLPVAGRFLALDIIDHDAPPLDYEAAEAPPGPGIGAAGGAADAAATDAPVESAEARREREARAVASAEDVLLQQIERAAGQGIIYLSDAAPQSHAEAAAPASGPAPAETAEGPAEHSPIKATGGNAEETTAAAQTEALGQPARTEDTPPPPRSVTRADRPVSLPAAEAPLDETGVAALLRHDQVRATTVYDRDRAAAARRQGAAESAPDCLPEDHLAVTDWAGRRPFRDQLADLHRRLLGEFDTPDPKVLSELVRLNLRFGLGLEAEGLLAAFPAEIEDRALYLDLARVVEARPLTGNGPLSGQGVCPGAHGLWRAIAASTPAYGNAEQFDDHQTAFEALPPDLRILVGPRFMSALIDAGESNAARAIYDTIMRTPQPANADLTLAEARLVAAEGNPAAALPAMAALVESNAANSAAALVELSRLSRAENLPLPDRLITDLETAAQAARGTAGEADLRAQLASARATRGELQAALDEIRQALAAHLDEHRFRELAAQTIRIVEPGPGKPAAYARSLLAGVDLLSPTPDGDAARAAAARRLLNLGLAPAARDVIAPAATRGDAGIRRLWAEALLKSGDGNAALGALSGLADPAAAALRAAAQADAGAYDAAVATLSAAGLEAEADAYAWPSGDWPRVVARGDDDPARTGMATFMERREGTAAAVAAAIGPRADPATLAPEAAFAEPVPSLEDPSLAAARQLLATGAKVGAMVQDLLTPPAPTTATTVSP